MNQLFKRLPLPAKFILMGLVPFLCLIYLSVELYNDKAEKVALLYDYKNKIDQSSRVYTLVTHLQVERKYSLDNALKKVAQTELPLRRKRTDSAIHILTVTGDSSVANFKSYTFLDHLAGMRGKIDSGNITAAQVMHYYTTTIFRVNSLTQSMPENDFYFGVLYKNLQTQKLLSEMIMQLGILRSHIYEALYENKDIPQTLQQITGIYELFKTYETEFLLKTPPVTNISYKTIRERTALKPTIDYIDTLYATFQPDNSYTAEEWWKVSEDAIRALRQLRQRNWEEVNVDIDYILKAEQEKKNWYLALLISAVLVVICTLVYTIIMINKILVELKDAAYAISTGVTGIPLQPVSSDAIGSLTESIIRIDSTNKSLTEAAKQIGNGDFSISLRPRGKDDELGNAIVKMQYNLQRISQENKDNEQALRKMAEKYKTIFYQSPLPKWIFDTETLRFLDINDAAVNHYGYSREEFLNMTIRDIRPEGDMDKFFHHIHETRINPYTNTSYWQHIKKNGEMIQVEITAHSIEYDNKPARMIIIYDVTERRKSEEEILQLNTAISKSEQRFRALTENNNEIIALVDQNMKTFYRSPASTRITGWTDAERNTMNSIEVVHPDDRIKVSAIYMEVLASPGKSLELTHRYLHKKGHYIWVEGFITNMLNDPSVNGIIVNLNDITERKKAEEKLLRSEKIYKTIASGIPGSVIALVDSEYRYLLIEGDMLENFGYSKEMLLGQKIIDVIPSDRYENVLPNLKRVFKGETFTVELTRNDFDFITRYVPLKDDNDSVYAAMTVSIDITELKNAQRSINEMNVNLEQKVAERTAQLEVVNKELEAFTYSVSHDLRAPLRIIDGFADILASDYAKVMDEEGNRIVSVIMNNAQRMGRLIDDLLNLSRLGRKPVAVRMVDMNKLVQSVIEEQRLLISNSPQIIKDDLLPAESDPNLITQVWINLISNALKYSGKKEQPVIHISSQKKDGEIVYSVTDNGVGFNMEYADKLFGVFQRLHKVKEFEGTGVGLALVQRIIVKHNGKVWASAKPNEGATFYFSLPINQL